MSLCLFFLRFSWLGWEWERKKEHLQQWQTQLNQLVPWDLCGRSRSRELWHSTTLLGTKTREGNWKERQRYKGKISKLDDRFPKLFVQRKLHDTHENHPIPQPKHGRGLSYRPICKSSTSLRRVYLFFVWSHASFSWPRWIQAHNVRMAFIINHFGHKWLDKLKTPATNIR